MRSTLVLLLLLAPLVWAATSTETELGDGEPNTIRDANGNDTGVTRGTTVVCSHMAYACFIWPCLSLFVLTADLERVMRDGPQPTFDPRKVRLAQVAQQAREVAKFHARELHELQSKNDVAQKRLAALEEKVC